ncbi:MAG: ATP-binding cassette domain-containing protein [Pseudomonadota bacterium]
MSDSILEVCNLCVYYPIGKTLFSRGNLLKAVDGVDMQVKQGEVFSIVGESGCGKSTIAKAILGIQKPTSGEIFLEGKPIRQLSRAELAGRVQPIFQDPYSSLNPRKTIEQLIAMPLLVRGESMSLLRDRVAALMEAVRLPVRLTHSYPSQLSGGQRQRIAIARALITDPDILICDEPTSALDVSVQAQVLDLLEDLRKERNLTFVIISHDLGVLRHISDRVGVIYMGRFVEVGSAEQVLEHPKHDYTKKLAGSVLAPDPGYRLRGVSFDHAH